MLSWHFSSFFFPMIKPNSHLFPLVNNTIHTCIKRAFVRYFHAIQETIYISKIKKSVMNIKIKTVSNFLHLIILHIGAHITLEQIKEVVGTTIGSLCFPLVWLFCDREVYFFLYPACNTMNIWVGTPASFDEDRGLAIEWQECFDESYICCLWLIFFWEGWDFCRNFNNQWQNCLSLELKKRHPKRICYL